MLVKGMQLPYCMNTYNPYSRPQTTYVSEMIAACEDSCIYPDWLKNAAEEMSLKSSSYNDQVSNIFTYMTAILDPRIKVELLAETLNSENNLDEARSHFLGNYSTSPFSVNNIYGASEKEGGSASFAEEIARKKRRVSMSVATDELTQYLSVNYELVSYFREEVTVTLLY
ncbi:uncharacterized protein LOC125495913 [Beta vulgaris subsp. vulgaris]|uniref:uncharacterized protein LOC125495913 n=1 Tax=Beta vulgaris subsp. vulgaris TaxID=3555 RepID=UPI0020371700|nr:uncharacterized protein LOC125495913 [Beta vulgaris subsp. vulgaris]